MSEMNEMPEVSSGMTPEPKKNNTTLIIAIVVVVLLCCCCVIGIPLGRYLWENGDTLLGVSINLATVFS